MHAHHSHGPAERVVATCRCRMMAPVASTMPTRSPSAIWCRRVLPEMRPTSSMDRGINSKRCRARAWGISTLCAATRGHEGPLFAVSSMRARVPALELCRTVGATCTSGRR